MPRGYYLGQGLIPLGYHSSDDDEGPCELPDGRVVCGPHGLVTCSRCCVDYSFMDDGLEEDDEGLEHDEDDDDHDNDQDIDLANALPIVELPSVWPSSKFPDPGSNLRRGNGLVFPAKFEPADNTRTPTELFSGRARFMRAIRYQTLLRHRIISLLTIPGLLD
jgi:ribonuclease HI